MDGSIFPLFTPRYNSSFFSYFFVILTQVVTLATYAYFVACLFGRQYLLPTQYKVEGDKYVPVGFLPQKHHDLFENAHFRWHLQ